MSSSESTPRSTAWDEAAAREWAESYLARTERPNAYPWRLAAIVSSLDRPVRRVLDVASGPGGFLGTVLEELPEATGVWFDFSQSMREAAVGNLSRFAGRVEFVIGDMVDIAPAGPTSSFDLITSSSATHHLLVGDLARFYTSVHEHLAIGGWVANLDNVAPSGPWGDLLRRAREVVRGPQHPTGGGHPHPNPFPTLEDHLAALRVAGFDDPRVVWSSLVSGLLMAQRHLGPSSGRSSGAPRSPATLAVATDGSCDPAQ